MNFSDISVPEPYLESQDFRFFLDWIADAFERIKFDHENLVDIYDPLRCPEQLLWMLGDTMGYKYDTRLPPAYCRLVLLYFMSMIRLKGSRDGITLAAEVNLDQFNIIKYGMEDEILYHRLEDTNIPVNSAYVTPYTDKGYIDVVYFSTEKPIDACIEYVRPIGMYAFQHSGVRFDAKAEISIDARLADSREMGISIGPTRVGHYSREDYARMQKMTNEEKQAANGDHKRRDAWYRNSDYEEEQTIPAGLRAMYSLQMSNNEHMIKSLLDPIFDLGFEPQDDSADSMRRMETQDKFLDNDQNPKWYNLRYNRATDQFITADTWVHDEDRLGGPTTTKQRVNPIMTTLGDAMKVDDNDTMNRKYYIRKQENGPITEMDADDIK